MAEPRQSRRIPELSMIEFDRTSALREFCDVSRRLSVDHSGELEWGAEEIQSALTITGKGSGNPWLMGLDVKARARRVAKRARRAAELQRGSAKELVKLWQDFTVQFGPILEAIDKEQKAQAKERKAREEKEQKAERERETREYQERQERADRERAERANAAAAQEQPRPSRNVTTTVFGDGKRRKFDFAS